MQACENQIERLVDAAAAELPEGTLRELNAHLSTCAGCREELAAMRSTGQLLRATSNTPDDFQLSGFAVRVADRAEAFRDRSTRGLWWTLTRAMRVTMGFSTAAALAALVLFVQSQHPAAIAQNMKPVVKAPVVQQVADDSATEVDEDELAADPAELAEEDRAEPSVSLDSALDSLTPEELDELTQKLATNAG